MLDEPKVIENFPDVAREHYETAKTFGKGRAFSASEFSDRYHELYPNRALGSILPADFTAQERNRGKPHFLRILGRASYEFIGLTDDHEGNPAPPLGQTIDRGKLEALRSVFLGEFPDFPDQKFKSSEGRYWAQERNYKQQLLNRAAAAMKASPPSGNEALGAELLATLIKPPSNLLGWRMKSRLRKVMTDSPGEVEVAAGQLATSGAEPAIAVATFVEAVWPLYIVGNEDNLPFGDIRAIPTMLLALAKPDLAIGVRFQKFQAAGELLLGRPLFGHGPLTQDEYANVVTLAREIFRIMRDEWGWSPRDLWDVQGFIWTTVGRLDPTGGESGVTLEPTEDDDDGQRPRPDSPPLNVILYGPPGTGKTYNSINLAVRILDPSYHQENERNSAALKGRYDELFNLGHIRFVTFHQTFAYEDFVEGLRADRDESGQLTYGIEDGIFKRLCDAASAEVTKGAAQQINPADKQIWKMSLGNTLGDDAYIYDECIEENYILLGYGHDIDFSKVVTEVDVRQAFGDRGFPLESEYAVRAVWTFTKKMKVGDLVIVSDGNQRFRAIGLISGEPRVHGTEAERIGYHQCRDVRWLKVFEPSLPREALMSRNFSQMTIYEIRPPTIDLAKLETLISGAPASQPAGRPFRVGDIIGREYTVEAISPELLRLRKPNGSSLPLDWAMLDELASAVAKGIITTDDIAEKTVFEKIKTRLEKFIVHGYQNIIPLIVEKMVAGRQATGEKPASRDWHSDRWVLIIDEINRGNISKIFGELISLIEPTKRRGASDGLTVQLPYSKSSFSVPSNLYLIGTMNTADRSLVGLDIALRRRFEFFEMEPLPDKLSGVVIEGIDCSQFLKIINERIEYLLDRDHRIGHAYFLPLQNDGSFARLEAIFYRQVFPLLQEYFFEDWEKIRLVLNDHRKPADEQFVVQLEADANILFGSTDRELASHNRWTVNQRAFGNPASYLKVISVRE